MDFLSKYHSDSQLDYEQRKKRDSELVKKALRNDSSAFSQLVGFYYHKVRALGISFFKNQADTEDFIQEVFLKAYTYLYSFRNESLFSTWLMRIAYNLAINAINRRKEYSTLSNEDLLLDTDLSPEEKQLQKATAEAVREAIKELPEKYAICLDLYFFYDTPYKEISKIIDIPENTIKSHIFRAKKILREKLTDLI